MSTYKIIEEFIPYGPEWEREVSKCTKIELVAMLSRISQKAKEFEVNFDRLNIEHKEMHEQLASFSKAFYSVWEAFTDETLKQELGIDLYNDCAATYKKYDQ